MTPAKPDYTLRLQQLEQQSRVPREAQVEMVDQAEVPEPDARGAQPDRDWFAAGG